MGQTTRELDIEWELIPAAGTQGRFIQKATRYVENIQARHKRIAAFEPSNYPAAAAVLNTVWRQKLATGNRFCEWGSGFGLVTCLASMAGFDASGIEISEKLVASARQLASDHDLDVRFQLGTYRPDWALNHDIKATAFHQSPDNSPFDFDLIYVYPWPAESELCESLFSRFAPTGSLLISYQGGGRFRFLRRLADAG
jgi:hypothetical protein